MRTGEYPSSEGGPDPALHPTLLGCQITHPLPPAIGVTSIIHTVTLGWRKHTSPPWCRYSCRPLLQPLWMRAQGVQFSQSLPNKGERKNQERLWWNTGFYDQGWKQSQIRLRPSISSVNLALLRPSRFFRFFLDVCKLCSSLVPSLFYSWAYTFMNFILQVFHLQMSNQQTLPILQIQWADLGLEHFKTLEFKLQCGIPRLTQIQKATWGTFLKWHLIPKAI